MSTKHTPGPWFYQRVGTSTIYVEGRLRPGWLQEVAACGPTEQGEQQEANARLIAAAPDLLEALVAMKRATQTIDPNVQAAASQICAEAIRKAIGDAQ